MQQEIYNYLESLFGLSIESILSGIGVAILLLVIGIIKYFLFRKKQNEDVDIDDTIFNIKGDVVNSSIKDIKVKSSSPVFKIGGKLKNSKIKRVDVDDER